ncbi:wd repeat-containing protein 75, partial [Lasius niger]
MGGMLGWPVSGTAKAVAVVPVVDREEKRETILVVESNRPDRVEVVAYQGAVKSAPKSKSLLVVKKPGDGLQLLEASADGQVLVGAFHNQLFLGMASKYRANNLDQLQYEFISFDTPDLITTLDMRVYKRP